MSLLPNRVSSLCFALIVSITVAVSASPPKWDLVIAGARVMDPESGLDAVRWVGIRNGRIESISESPIEGGETLDASNHVLAPGFIDLHIHGQDPPSYDFLARDGVT